MTAARLFAVAVAVALAACGDGLPCDELPSYGVPGAPCLFGHCAEGTVCLMPRRWAVALGPDGEARIIGDRMISAEAATPWEMVQRLWIFAASKGTVTQ